MDRLVQTQLGMVKHEVVDTAGNHAEGRASYDVFLYFERCSQSLFRQGVTLDFANSDADAGGCAARQHAVIASTRRRDHTYSIHGV